MLQTTDGKSVIIGRRLNLDSFTNVEKAVELNDDIIKGELQYAFDGYNEKVQFAKTGGEIVAALNTKLAGLQASADLIKVKIDAYGAELKELEQEPSITGSSYGYVLKEEALPTFDTWNYRKQNSCEDKGDSTSELMNKYNDLVWSWHNAKSDINFVGTLVRNLDVKKKYTLTAKQLNLLGF